MKLPHGPSRAPFIQTLQWIRRPLELLDSCGERYGARFTLRFVGNRNFVMLWKSDDVRNLFLTPPERFLTGNPTMRKFFGENSMMVLEGERHKRHRRLIGPALRGDRLSPFGALIGQMCKRDLDAWSPGETRPIIERMRDITLLVIIGAIFGVTDPERIRLIQRLVGEVTDSASGPVAFLPLLQVDLGRHSPWGRFIRLRRELEEVLGREVVRARNNPEGREDILARMVVEGRDQGDPLSDQEIVEELMTLLAAGHETSTCALAWAFQWILLDPAVQRRVVDEVRGAATVHGKNPMLDHDALEKLPYLEAVVFETLRRHPIIPLMPRLCSDETTIGDLTVPAGTYLTACAHLAQHDPASYEQPRSFKPERFLGKRPNPFEWMPFGGGHRYCLGGAFALYEMRAILGNFFLHADLAMPDAKPQRFKRRGITLTPHLGTPVRLVKRAS